MGGRWAKLCTFNIHLIENRLDNLMIRNRKQDEKDEIHNEKPMPDIKVERTFFSFDQQIHQNENRWVWLSGLNEMRKVLFVIEKCFRPLLFSTADPNRHRKPNCVYKFNRISDLSEWRGLTKMHFRFCLWICMRNWLINLPMPKRRSQEVWQSVLKRHDSIDGQERTWRRKRKEKTVMNTKDLHKKVQTQIVCVCLIKDCHKQGDKVKPTVKRRHTATRGRHWDKESS